jgi:hypothetical protein
MFCIGNDAGRKRRCQMKCRWLLGVVLLGLMLGAATCDEPIEIACLGNSITESGYPAELQYLLDVEETQAYDVIPYSEWGIGIQRMEEIAQTMPDTVEYVVVLAGINDCQWNPISTVISRYESLLSYLRSRGFVVIFVEHYDWAAYVNYPGPECSEAVNDWLYAQMSLYPNDVRAVVDMSSMGDGEFLLPQYDSGDGLHPNDDGDYKIAREIKDQGL